MRYSHAIGAVGAEVDDEFVVLSPGMELLALDATGRVIWESLAAPATVEEVAAAVCSRFDVQPEVARTDVEAYLGTLAGRGLVVTS